MCPRRKLALETSPFAAYRAKCCGLPVKERGGRCPRYRTGFEKEPSTELPYDPFVLVTGATNEVIREWLWPLKSKMNKIYYLHVVMGFHGLFRMKPHAVKTSLLSPPLGSSNQHPEYTPPPVDENQSRYRKKPQ